MTTPTPKIIERARKFLEGRTEPLVGGKSPSRLSPKDFAQSSMELGKSFEETLNTLAYLASGGQGMGPSPITTKDEDRIDAAEALGDEPPSQEIGEAENA